MSKNFIKAKSIKSLLYFTQISELYRELDFLKKLILEKDILRKKSLDNILSKNISGELNLIDFNNECKLFIRLFEETSVLENIYKEKNALIDEISEYKRNSIESQCLCKKNG